MYFDNERITSVAAPDISISPMSMHDALDLHFIDHWRQWLRDRES
jgi:hypothetical protein